MTLIAIVAVALVALVAAAMVVGPWLGWKLALDYAYHRFCLYSDPDVADLSAWDSARNDAHSHSVAQVWRQMLLYRRD